MDAILLALGKQLFGHPFTAATPAQGAQRIRRDRYDPNGLTIIQPDKPRALVNLMPLAQKRGNNCLSAFGNCRLHIMPPTALYM
jgi:hypothetical protein